MFDNPINILVLIILIAGWALLIYLVVSLIKGNVKKVSGVPDQDELAKHPVLQKKSPSILENMPGEKMAQIVPIENPDGVLLSIEVPKDNETTPLAAELMFSSLHGIYKPELEKVKGGVQDSVSFEMQAHEKSIRFFVWVPKYLQGYVEGQIYAQYQGVNIQEVKDYANPSRLDPSTTVVGAELVLNREDIFPIK